MFGREPIAKNKAGGKPVNEIGHIAHLKSETWIVTHENMSPGCRHPGLMPECVVKCDEAS
jgi:hypothetical protein